MNDGAAAKHLGFKRNYFYVLKGSNRLLYDKVKAVDKEGIHIGWLQHLDESDNLLNELQNIYFELQETKSVHKLAKFAAKKKIYRSEHSARTTLENTLFLVRVGNKPLQYRSLLKLSKLLTEWKKDK